MPGEQRGRAVPGTQTTLKHKKIHVNCHYKRPDSKKFGILAEYPPDKEGKPTRFIFVGREDINASYWDGE